MFIIDPGLSYMYFTISDKVYTLDCYSNLEVRMHHSTWSDPILNLPTLMFYTNLLEAHVILIKWKLESSEYVPGFISSIINTFNMVL